MVTGLPYSGRCQLGFASNQAAGTCSGPAGANDCLQPYSSGVAGTGVSSYIPAFVLNQLLGLRKMVVDARLQKYFRLYEGVTFQVLAEGFNLANHRNITGLNTGAFSLANNVLTATTNFGTPSSSGVNGNYAYQVRQFQFGGRIFFLRSQVFLEGGAFGCRPFLLRFPSTFVSFLTRQTPLICG